MVKLGELRNRKRWERISFRDWVAKGLARSGKYSVRVIFPPNRFPSFTIVFEDAENDMEVRLSLQSEKVKQAFQALGLQLKKANLPALVVEVQADENGIIYGLDIDKETPTQLVWKGSYWARWNSLSEPWDDDLTKDF